MAIGYSPRRTRLICVASISCVVLYKYVNLSLGVASSDLYAQNHQLRHDSSIDGFAYRFHRASPGAGPLRNASMGDNYRCLVGSLPNGINRTDILPPALQEPGLFDFATSVKTDKAILFIGDSVTQQLSEAFDESLGITKSWSQHPRFVNNGSVGYRQGLGYKDGNKERISFSAPTNGGGASAYWRMTDIWTATNKNKLLPPHTGGGWNGNQAEALRRQLMSRFNTTEFNAVVMNYNNWVWPEPEVLEVRYKDAVQLAKSTFNASTIILVTYPFTKTVNSTERWNDVHEYNSMLRRIAFENNRKASNDTIILVLEFGNFTNQLLWTNAKSIGVDVSDPRDVSSIHGWELHGNITSRFTNSPVCPFSATVGKLCLHMPVICAEYADENTDCLRNYISFDDMHWCTETIGARWSAGVACLLGCSLNKCNGREASVSTCQRRCNDQFMTLNPIKQEWVDGGSWFGRC